MLLAALNTLRPFREGNGRTQRAFVQAVAQQAHSLYFDTVSRERMVRASISSMQGDALMMIRLFQEITDANRVTPLRRAIAFLEANGSSGTTSILRQQRRAGPIAGGWSGAIGMHS